MEKQRLTLENVQEIGLDLLKKENYNSNEFQIYWDYNDQIVPDDMEEIREIKDKIGTEHLSDAVAEFILERNSMSDYSEELIESVLKKYCDYNENSEEYQNLKEELDNIVFDEFTFDVNEMDLIEAKGQEFWDNMDYYNINDWDNLLKSGEVIGVSINEVEEKSKDREKDL